MDNPVKVWSFEDYASWLEGRLQEDPLLAREKERLDRYIPHDNAGLWLAMSGEDSGKILKDFGAIAEEGRERVELAQRDKGFFLSGSNGNNDETYRGGIDYYLSACGMSLQHGFNESPLRAELIGEAGGSVYVKGRYFSENSLPPAVFFEQSFLTWHINGGKKTAVEIFEREVERSMDQTVKDYQGLVDEHAQIILREQKDWYANRANHARGTARFLRKVAQEKIPAVYSPEFQLPSVIALNLPDFPNRISPVK